jgi:protein gp37
MEHTKIPWVHHTYSSWQGCVGVSPGCDHCCACRDATRFKLALWGNHPRERPSPQYLRQPLRWDRRAAKTGQCEYVLSNYLSDFFDNQAEPEWRIEHWDLIRRTPNLIWMLLTKRPQNILKMLPPDWGAGGWDNVWLGVSVENMTEAHRRLPILLSVPAVRYFSSAEPLLEALDLRRWLGRGTGTGITYPGLDLVICGGESGPGWRPMKLAWPRDLRVQCRDEGCAFFMKQIAFDYPRDEYIPPDLRVREWPPS